MSKELRLISLPFHNGLREVGMGLGAARLASDDAFRQGLDAAGWSVSVQEVEAVDPSGAEIARVMELIRRLSRSVREAIDAGAFPLVLAGNCNSSLGTVAALGAEDLGVVWLDAHADFDDPEENISGFFDVMGLAMLTGRGWRALRATIPGHQPVPERHVVLGAVRDLEPYQRERLEKSDLRVVGDAVDPDRFAEALSELSSHASRIYLHIDLDSLDASEGRANQYAADGGPSLERLLGCVRASCERFTVAAAALTAYDPAADEDRRVLAAAREIGGELGRSIAGR